MKSNTVTCLAALAAVTATGAASAAVLNGDFESGPITPGDFNVTIADVDEGWHSGGSGANVHFDIVEFPAGSGNNVGALNREDLNGVRGLTQVNTDNRATIGINTFTADVFSNDLPTPTENSDNNALSFVVLGSNTSDFDFTVADTDSTMTRLATIVAPIQNEVDFTTSVSADIDFGTGFDFIAIRAIAQFQPGQGNANGGLDYVRFDNVDITPIPEPGSMLAGTALLGLLLGRRRR